MVKSAWRLILGVENPYFHCIKMVNFFPLIAFISIPFFVEIIIYVDFICFLHQILCFILNTLNFILIPYELCIFHVCVWSLKLQYLFFSAIFVLVKMEFHLTELNLKEISRTVYLLSFPPPLTSSKITNSCFVPGEKDNMFSWSYFKLKMGA